MATTPVIDVDALLVPIPGDHPSGKDLAYEPDYDAIREARRSEDDLPSGDWQREVKVADWDQVIALCSDCLGRKTKDLQIAAWLTEALARLFGFAGLRDGFRLLHGLQEHFWETCYPAIEDGDLESRIGPFLFLNDPRLLPLLIRNIPLTDGFGGERYSYLRYRESRETDNALRKNPDLEETLRAEGKITSKQFDDAVVQTPKAFYAQIVEDLRACLESFRAFERSTDEHFGAQAPSLLNIGQALHECQTLLEAILTEKRKTEPDPAPPLAPAAGDGLAPIEPPAAAAVAVAAPPEPVLSRLDQALPGLGLRLEVLDCGRLLIDFHQGAQELAEAGARLKANRQKHAELLEELRRLDAEYEQIAQAISRDQEFYQLLARLLQIREGGVSP